MFDPSNIEAEKKFMQADNLIKDKRIDEAMDVLYGIIQDYPSYGPAYNHLGWIYETKVKNLDKAEEFYKKALDYDPSYRASYYNFAIVLSTAKRFDELENLLKKALEVNGINRGTIYNEYAIMYELQEQYDLAIDYYKKYISQLFDDATIDRAVASLERCKKKRDILGRF